MEDEQCPGWGQNVHGKYLCFPLFCCEPVSYVKSKVNLFPEERGKEEKKEGGPVGGRHGQGGWGGSTVSKGWHRAAAGALPSFPATLRPGAGTLLDPRVSCLRAHPSRVRGPPLASDTLPAAPRCNSISAFLFSAVQWFSLPSCVMQELLTQLKLSCHLQLPPICQLFGENVNF